MRHAEVNIMTADHHDTFAPRPSAERIKKRLTNKALNYLGRYSSTSFQLETILRKFVQRKFNQADPALLDQLIPEVIKNCVRLGYIDDEAFIRSQFRQGIKSGFSKRRILLKLSQRGINRQRAVAVMEEQIGRAVDEENSDLSDQEFLSKVDIGNATKKGILFSYAEIAFK